ncbi:MAG: glycogen synthase GlgA, partial [Thermoflexales bacterium]|nr:glycogen synthase GlgA [Thermoflexales bacterium]
MNVLFVAAECAPFAKTGGLADVVGALPRYLRDLGHNVIVVMPRYSSIDGARHSLRWAHGPMGVWMGDTEEWCAVFEASNSGTPVYFIESRKYFDRWGLYHDANFNDYLDNPRRFGFLTRAALQLCKDLNFKPDIVHAHDWHTALAPAYLKIWHWNDPVLGGAASVLTIHNVAYQGKYSAEHMPYLGLQWGNFTPDKFEDHGAINFLKGGIVYADMVTTVSPTYARETRTPELGYGMAPYLNNKGDRYVGILNGCDYAVWNPETDPLIPARYSAADLSGKRICKRALQERMNLELLDDAPIIGVVSRFVAQKGLHLLAQCIEGIVTNMRVQFAILGSGDKGLEHVFGSLPARYPGRIGSYIGYDEALAHLIEAGSDFFLMPSIFEPCGLNQMYSLRYGTLPIVRATGGLEDTVQQYDERTGQGTGFKFYEPSAHAVYYTVGWVVST